MNRNFDFAKLHFVRSNFEYQANTFALSQKSISSQYFLNVLDSKHSVMVEEVATGSS